MPTKNKPEKREIKFWRQAIKTIHKGYGKPCKEFVWGCSCCEANLAAAWMQKHIDLLNWSLDYPIKKSKSPITKRRGK